MKKLLLILALTVPSFAFCTEPVESCVIVKQSYQEVKQFSFKSKPRFTMEGKNHPLYHCSNSTVCSGGIRLTNKE